MMVVDVKRAFLHGLCTRSIYIELPGNESDGGEVRGEARESVYGTRDAPLAWLTVVKSDMKHMGFEECKVMSGVFTHRVRDLRVVSHVDDFLLFLEERKTSSGSMTRCQRHMNLRFRSSVGTETTRNN